MNGAGRRAKGANYQRHIRHYFEARGWTVMVRPPGEDGDDITIIEHPNLSIEVKNHTRTDLPAWTAQAARQAGQRIPVVIHKRHGTTNPDQQWVTMTLDNFTRLINKEADT